MSEMHKLETGICGGIKFLLLPNCEITMINALPFFESSAQESEGYYILKEFEIQHIRARHYLAQYQQYCHLLMCLRKEKYVKMLTSYRPKMYP